MPSVAVTCAVHLLSADTLVSEMQTRHGRACGLMLLLTLTH
jgi:hypothetical protein